jgi:hypothetical protein
MSINDFAEEDIEFLKANYQNMTIEEIASALEKTYSCVFFQARKIGLSKTGCKNNKWSDDEISFIKEHYQDMTTNEIAEYLNRTPKAVHVKKSRLGLKNDPIYSYDRNKFEKILTEDDAYWLGFLYADGYVCHSNNSWWYGVELQYRDIGHLKKLNKYMNGNMHIDTFYHKSPTSENICKMCKIVYCSKQLFLNLANCGCMQRKSKVITMPFGVVPEQLIRHFIRGYFDGDGSCGIYRHSERKYIKYPRAKITCGSHDFVNQLKEYLNNINIRCGIVTSKEGNYDIFFSGKDNVVNFLKYMYNESNIYLDRKYEIYKQCLDLQ